MADSGTKDHKKLIQRYTVKQAKFVIIIPDILFAMHELLALPYVFVQSHTLEA